MANRPPLVAPPKEAEDVRPPEEAGGEARASWLPLLVVVLTQIQVSFTVNALTVSMAGVTSDLGIAPTSIGTAITTGTFAMAAFILLGAKIGSKFGSRLVFQLAVVIHGLAMGVVALAVNGGMLLAGQAIGGAVIALLAPTLTVFIADNYRGSQQAQAIGYLAAAIPAAGVLALLIAGTLASTIGWRYSFGLLVALAALNLFLSFRVRPVPAQRHLGIDWVGALLSSTAIILLSVGFSGLTAWGPLIAKANAPFNVVGLSPAPFLILLGIVLGQVFFSWTRRRQAANQPQLFSLDVIDTAEERATTFCMATMLFVGTAANFLIPLYMQMVQGLSSLQTSFSIIPYTLSIFIANTLVARLYDRVPPRTIARIGFVVVAAALALIGFTIRNEWGQLFIVLGLITLGLAQGAIVALVFNTLLSASPKELAGDDGAWRGLVHNISGSVGIAVAGAVAVGLLSTLIVNNIVNNPLIPPELKAQINLDNVNFITNEQLEDVLAQTTATPEQVDEAVRVNAEMRLRSLRASLLLLSGLALLAVIPAGKMPGYVPGDIPVGYPAEDGGGRIRDDAAPAS
ncbi:MAG TPA: MFS transporter [Chloroflexi bacterium]|nr:MFS transporter [Chloroflexota bacterium]